MVPFIDIGKMSSDLVNDSALQGPMSFVGQMTFKVRHTLCNFTIQVIVRDSCNLRLESCTNASFRVPPTGYRPSTDAVAPSELRKHAPDHRRQQAGRHTRHGHHGQRQCTPAPTRRWQSG